MIILSRITLFLALAGWVSAEERGSSIAAFQQAQIETSKFTEVTKGLKVGPLGAGNSTTVVRMIADSGWAVSSALTIRIPAAQGRPVVAELIAGSFDDPAKENTVKTLRADLTPDDTAALQKALSSGKSFKRPQEDRSSRAIDSGWYFIEMQTATDYKWIFLYGSGGAHSDSKELVTALLHVKTHMLATNTRKGSESASKLSAENSGRLGLP